MLIPPNSKLLMIGDSITDSGRARPVGEGLFNAQGDGYVRVIAGLVGACAPLHRLRIVNMGSSGNTVRDLRQRWQTDVIDLAPDWVSVMIGINDVWRQFDLPMQPDQGVPLAEYAATLEELVKLTTSSGISMILMTPYYIEENREDRLRAMLDGYGEVVKRLAKEYGAICVDTQAAFDRYLIHEHSAMIAWDRVHPTFVGHTLIARAFLDAVGFQW